MVKPDAGLDYRLVVPSRGRPDNMARIQRLLPTATIVVAEDERDRYLAEVDADKLVCHPGAAGGVSGLPAVLNWIWAHFDEDTVVEADDDLLTCKAWTGESARRVWQNITNPEDVLQIIENGVRIAQDLDITAFGWGKSQNAAFAKPDHKPITPTGLVANVFGVRGAAKKRPYDPLMIGRASVDWTLRTLLEDRCVMIDKRVFFDCGTIFGGAGGNAGIVTEEKFRLATQRLRERWGGHVSFGGSNTAAASGTRKTDKDGKTIARVQGDRQVSMKVTRHAHGAAK